MRSNFKLMIPLILCWLSLPLSSAAQTGIREVVTTKADINADGKLEFTNRIFDTEIKTWENNYVELQMHITIEAEKREDIDETLKAVREIAFSGTLTHRSVNTGFWKSINSDNNRKKVRLNTGATVVLKNFTVENILYVPKTVSLIINSKYADIQMQDIAGSADLNIFSGKLYCHSIAGKTSLDLHYSKAFMVNIPEAVFNLYDSDIEINNCGDFDIESKFSTIEIEHAGDMVVDSYNDKFNIGTLNIVEGKAKYSKFEFDSCAGLFCDFYDSDIDIGKTNTVKGESKYSEFKIHTAGDMVVERAYNDIFRIDTLRFLSSNDSKYSVYDIDYMNGDITLYGYNDELKVANVNRFFQITLDGKYNDIGLAFPDTVPFRLLVDMKYGNVDLPDDKFIRKTYIRENSDLFIDATMINYDENNKRLVEIRGYENMVTIKQ